MEKQTKKSWIGRHPILAILLTLIGISIVWSAIRPAIPSNSNPPQSVVQISSDSIVPSDSEIDREWLVDPITPISSTSKGFLEGSEREIKKSQDLSATSITMQAYRFDSPTNAANFYNAEKQKIDVRGVKEWDLGSDCFGIDRGTGLSGIATGLCLRGNIVLHIDTASSSIFYTSDGEEFMKLMLKKV